jgi:hypothetical protein
MDWASELAKNVFAWRGHLRDEFVSRLDERWKGTNTFHCKSEVVWLL